MPCECCDPGCPACVGKCTAPATVVLRRHDLAGEPECSFCEACAVDALDSGVFSVSEWEG